MDNWFEFVVVITGILQMVVTVAEWVEARRARRSKPGGAAGPMDLTHRCDGHGHNWGMYVRVDRSSVSLVDGENFREFAVVVEGEDVDLDSMLDGLGVVDADGEHVFLDARAVRDMAGEWATEEWVGELERMIEFARSKGWVDEAGRVRAHIERR